MVDFVLQTAGQEPAALDGDGRPVQIGARHARPHGSPGGELLVGHREAALLVVLRIGHRLRTRRGHFAKDNLLTRGQEVAVEVNTDDAVDIELQPGEFSLHHVRLVHGSDPNDSDQRRIGYAIRYIPTYVKQTVGPRDCATLVRGVDTYHHFDPEIVPKADMDPEAVAFHKRVTDESNQVLYRGTDKRNPK